MRRGLTEKKCPACGRPLSKPLFHPSMRNLHWLSKQTRPMWGGIGLGGIPVSDPQMLLEIEKGWIIEVTRHGVHGWVITDAGLAALAMQEGTDAE